MFPGAFHAPLGSNSSGISTQLVPVVDTIFYRHKVSNDQLFKASEDASRTRNITFDISEAIVMLSFLGNSSQTWFLILLFAKKYVAQII